MPHEEKIAQTSTQGMYTPSPESTQFLALQQVKINLQLTPKKNQSQSAQKKGSSLSNTENVPQTRSEPYMQRYNLNDIKSQE